MSKRATGCLIALGIFLALLVALFLATLLTLRAPSIKANTVLELPIEGTLIECPPTSMLERFFMAKVTVVWEVLQVLQTAAKDNEISGVILKISPLNSGLAKIQELRKGVIDFKRSGKFVLSFLETAGNKEYYLASAADEVCLVPVGDLNLTGLVTEVTFYRGFFDKWGMIPNFEHIGEYKSASDILTRKEMSPAHREATDSLLDSLYQSLLKDLAQRNKLSNPQNAQELIDKGPFTAQEALEEGLVDQLLYEDQFYELVRQKNKGQLPLVTAKDYQRSAVRPPAWGRRPKIALIYATGTIATGDSFYAPLVGRVMGSKTICQAIRSARKNNSIKGIVFRIDSPGGSALASDIIWREVELTRGKKPFVVTMSDTAASGGYYIAMGADKIVAQPTTVTGSIGVISGKFDLRGLYDRLGINKEVITRGKNADLFSDYRSFSPEEKEILLKMIGNIYKNFVHKAALGREMTDEEIDSIGRGRVWTGEQAKGNGLVDELGGITEAVSLIKEMANIPAEEEVEVVIYPRVRPLIWSRWLEIVKTEGINLPEELLSATLGLTSKARELLRERVFTLLPYSIRFR
ncbi:signal peptide peptidase SppA [bacterium (candidate division B38) B3_B38]|nr:MAG: signal peptide peptidase SppA [bacterium (candidate division B38) B3_B38]